MILEFLPEFFNLHVYIFLDKLKFNYNSKKQ